MFIFASCFKYTKAFRYKCKYFVKMPKIAIVVPFHLRGTDGANLTANLQCLERLERSGVFITLAGSTLEDSQFSRPFAIDYVNVPQSAPVMGEKMSGGNDVLRKKFNDSLKAIRGVEADWYCLVGANDIISREFWNWLSMQYSDLPCLAGVSSAMPLYLTDNTRSAKIRPRYTTGTILHGGVNAFNAHALDSCGWEPYKYHGDEVALELKLAKGLNWQIAPGPGWVCSVKGPVDLNSYSHVLGAHRHEQIPDLEMQILRRYGI